MDGTEIESSISSPLMFLYTAPAKQVFQRNFAIYSRLSSFLFEEFLPHLIVYLLKQTIPKSLNLCFLELQSFYQRIFTVAAGDTD